MDAVTSVPVPFNEPVKGYAPGSSERETLQKRVAELESERVELTSTIAGEQRMAGGESFDVVQPHKKAHVLGVTREATASEVADAVAAAKAARADATDITPCRRK